MKDIKKFFVATRNIIEAKEKILKVKEEFWIKNILEKREFLLKLSGAKKSAYPRN